MNRPKHPRTRAVRAGLESDPVTGAVVPPIHLTSTFAFEGFGKKRQYDYSRSGNPTRDLLAAAINDLEGGAGCVVTGSGMAAIHLCGQVLARGARLLVPHDCYGGSYRLFAAWQRRGDFRVEFVDFGKSAAVEQAMREPFDLLWIETPSNPLLRITDIAHLSARAHEQGALVVADNTFLSPVLQQPLALGVDMVVHSTTKYLNGHSDVVGGAVVAATPEWHEKVAWWANASGATGSSFDSFLTLRGMRSLHARMAYHEENANQIAAWLAEQPAVSKVFYPGLSSHPQHALAKRQQSGFGAIVSFELKGGAQAVERLVANLELFSLAESLGGVESLIAHPATMTHAAMDPAARTAAGLTDGLLRLSIGIESADDLLEDLARGFKALA
ncbi:MAG: cystathionine gamma-synthase [Gammaproteobacteria bacterium]|nr:cystathionine gamma-synthase [Gammaproteobacteria bacterium]